MLLSNYKHAYPRMSKKLVCKYVHCNDEKGYAVNNVSSH